MTDCRLSTLECCQSSSQTFWAPSTILTMSACEVSGTRVSTRCVDGSFTSIHPSGEPAVHSPPMMLVVLPPFVLVP